VINGNTQSDVQSAVTASLANSGISVGTVTPSPSDWATAAGGTAVTVSLSVPYSQVTWLSTPLYFNITNLSASATMSSERP